MKKRIFSLLTSLIMVISLAAVLPVMNLKSKAVSTAITGGTSKYNAINIDFSKEYAITLAKEETRWFKFTTKSQMKYWYNLTVHNVSVGNNNGFSGVSGCIYDKYDEKFANALPGNGGKSTDGGKLETDTVYYVVIWGCREGTIKFQLDPVYDQYEETKNKATTISFNKYYESSIDCYGSLADDRQEDALNGDVDYVKFYTGNKTKVRLNLKNSDVDYYNTYFEGVAAIVTDSFGEKFTYLEVRPNKEKTTELNLSKNTYYYIKIFATSGGVGKYKFKIECIHNWDNGVVTNNSTCKEHGIKTYTCKQCSTTYTLSMPLSSHKYTTTVVKPTCTAQGYTLHTCSRCSTSYKDTYTNAKGHSYGSWTTTKAATCTTDGTQIRKCSTCGKAETQTIKATGHSYKSVTVKSTHFAKGYTAKKCSKCSALTNKKTTALLTMAAPKASSNKTNSVKLSWSKASGAKGYDVYQKKSGKWVKIKSTTSTSYTVKKLKAGTTYKFTVKPYKKSNSKTVYGNRSKTLTTSTNPATVSFKVTGGSKKALVQWNKVTGATGYKVYYKTSKNGKRKCLKTTNNKTTKYTKTGLKKGKTYYFSVKAYRTVGGKTYNGKYNTKSVKVK